MSTHPAIPLTDYPLGPAGQVIPYHYDLRVELEDAELALTLYRLRTGQPVQDEETTPPETVCRRYVTTDLGEPVLGWRKRGTSLRYDWVDTWAEVHGGTVEQVVADLLRREPCLAPYRDWVGEQVADLVAEADR